ncbi:DUF5916 domain-containing protein [Pontibacter sp. SGAir0037]|uniref:DUF5916 domain-containing protein n=1 Tax=Pontibacter sp. SGAir0037 TaxID=2571030 RepID=UPI0010F4405F|nr:DUF5916 domain-containing protein [Pontibacter sp. SGAir0037]
MKNFFCRFFTPFTCRLFLLLFLPGFAAQAQEVKSVPQPPKQLQALRITEPVKIDGILDEPIWQQAEIATDFIQNRPNPGPKEVHPTAVRILYDDVAIYVGAIMHDVSPDSILRQLGQRDDIGNTDFFGIFLDTYNDQINGFGFLTTPAGVQLDARYSSNGEDWSWNAVWESNASIQGNNWIAEFKIPYSALRFSSKPEQVWGLNFMRNRQVTRRGFFWNHVDPAKDGFVNQFGKLVGIKDIKAPLRLSLTPYVSGFGVIYPANTESSGKTDYNHDFNFSGGMDVKYGISDAFTLDMTLIPDFSQVQSDNRVLNLSPFEVQFNENRPFFMEGTELFNKGDFFYSRRIGSSPINYLNAQAAEAEGYTVIQNPTETKMLNGTKLSGRTSSGLGIGVFNAVVGRTYATLEDEQGNRTKRETHPLTNYNIAVLDQSLKNNSYVTLVNTNVMREGKTYDANLTGMLFRLANKGNKYAVSGRGALSQRFFTDKTDLGHTYELGVGKVSGNFQFSASHKVISDTYNPNDMGILFTNNTSEQSVGLQYNIYQPFWKMLNLYTNIEGGYARRYKPDAFQNFYLNSNINGTFKNFMSAGAWLTLEPVTTYDFFEPRIGGAWYYTYPTNYGFGGWVSSDYRKKLALDVEIGYRGFNENSRHNISIYVSPRYRVNDRLSFTYTLNNNTKNDDIGFVNHFNADRSAEAQDTIMFGRRNVKTTTNTLAVSYIFSNRMSITLRARHYWSGADYKQYYQLTSAGMLQEDSYPLGYSRYGVAASHSHNINYNTFNVDMVYSWWFAPGSEISIVWKNAIEEEVRQLIPGYYDNFSRTMSAPQTNSLSVKVLYYIDYLMLKNKLAKK